MANEIEVASQFDQMNKVVEELLKGSTVASIAKSLNLTRVQVENHIDNWKEFAHNNNNIKSRALEALAGADQHFSMLIQEAWDVINEAGNAGELGNKNSAIKIVGDLETKRIEMLQKAGLLQNNEMADQILETERKQELLIGILKEVTANCDHCKWEVNKRLSEVTGHVEAVVIN